MTAAVADLSGADRRERGMERWRARSRLIRRLRVILPGAMAAIVTLLVAWVAIGGLLARIGEAHPAGQALIHMTNARFFGRDSGGRPYVLSAQEASRDDKDLRLVTLTQPSLALDAGSDRASHISADHGLYREDDRIVRLDGHVALQNPDGDVFHTDRAIADTTKGTVVGPSPVSGMGRTGDIDARSFVVLDRGAQVVFRGEVHSRLKRD